MANINVSEADFQALAEAAEQAQRLGDRNAAEALDKIARKMNAALSNASVSGPMVRFAREHKKLTWRDVPSTLDA